MRKKLLALALALVCAALPGCGGGTQTPAPQDPAPASNELRVGIAQDLDDTLDPHKTVAAGTREVLFNVFEGLVKPSPEGELIPAVAEGWELSDDHLTYTFHIRQGITFHDGSPVTAGDAAWSLLRLADPQEADVAAVAALSAIASVETPDAATLVLTLSEPSPEFLSYLTAAVLPADYADQDTQPIGTGPFRFVSRTAQESVILERYDGYWGDLPALERVTYRIFENADSILLGIQAGAVDLFAHLTRTQAAQLPEDFLAAEGYMNLVQALYLNNAVEPFNDVRVRQALCYAVDVDALLDLAFDGYGFPIGSSMYPAFGKYYDPSLADLYPHDTEKAKALLAEAGYPDGFSMTITVPSNYQPHVDTAQVLAAQLEEVGVQAEIVPVEWGAWLEDVYQGRNFESTVIGVDAANMTARALLERFVSTAGNNFINYHSAAYDALFAAAQSAYDDAEQTAIYREMERNLAENAANVYLQDMADLVAVRKGLQGLQFYPIYALDLSTLYWAE